MMSVMITKKKKMMMIMVMDENIDGFSVRIRFKSEGVSGFLHDRARRGEADNMRTHVTLTHVFGHSHTHTQTDAQTHTKHTDHIHNRP